MKTEKIIPEEMLNELPVMFRTLTLKRRKTVKTIQKNKYHKSFYKATILPFRF